MSEEIDQRHLNARRRMRGLATFFLVVSLMGVCGAAILIAAGDQRRSIDDLIGVATLSSGLFFAALATWNGSRIGAGILVLLILLTPLSVLIGVVELRTLDWLRSGLYFVLAMIMLVSAFQYRHAVHGSSEPFGGAAWLRWSGKTLAGGVLGFLCFGFSIIAFGSSTAVFKGTDLSSEQIEWLSEQGYLTPTERPLYAYLDGLFSIEEGGSLLTDEYVGGWWKEDGALQSVWIKLGEVCEVKTVNEGSLIQDAIYSVHSPGDESWVQLWLSVEDNLHKQFISRMKTLNDRKMRPEIQQFCDEGRPIDWVEIATKNGISQDIVEGVQVTDDQREWMTEQGFLLEGEEILNFYSFGKFSISEEGSLLTDQYLGGWLTEDGQLESWWMEIGEICDIGRPENPGESETALYRLNGSEAESWIDLRFPTRNGQSETLADRVTEMIAQARTDEQLSSCQARSLSEQSVTP